MYIKMNNINKYRKLLLQAFPILPVPEFTTIPNTFCDEDNVGFQKAVSTFEGKTWDNVVLYPDDEDELVFSTFVLSGKVKEYYFPAFLNNYIDINTTLDTKTSISTIYIDRLDITSILLAEEDIVFYKNMNLTQSKLVAYFLLTQWVLINDPYAKKALDNFWAKFLI